MRHLILILTIELFCSYCYGQTNNWSKRIKSYEHWTLSQFMNPCGGPISTLKIDGKKFERVRGCKPFYLVLTNIESILFVVNEPDFSMSYHIFNMKTDQDTKIRSKGDLFGNLIGFKPVNPSNSMNDSVDVISSNLISTCATMRYDSPDRIVQHFVRLDLLNKMVASRENIVSDTNGIVKRRTFKEYPKP